MMSMDLQLIAEAGHVGYQKKKLSVKPCLCFQYKTLLMLSIKKTFYNIYKWMQICYLAFSETFPSTYNS